MEYHRTEFGDAVFLHNIFVMGASCMVGAELSGWLRFRFNPFDRTMYSTIFGMSVGEV